MWVVVLWKQSIDQHRWAGRHRNSGSSGSSIRWFVVYIIRDFPLPHWACQDSMLSQCLALPHILWVCLFQWEIPIYDDLWQFQWGTSDSRSGSGGNLEPSRTWKTIGWNPWFPMDFPLILGDQTHHSAFAGQVLRLRSQLSEMQAKGLAWSKYGTGHDRASSMVSIAIKILPIKMWDQYLKKWSMDVHSDYPVVREPRSYMGIQFPSCPIIFPI